MGFIISLVLAPDPFNSFQADEANYSGVVKEIKEYDSSRSLIVSIDSADNNYCRPFLAKIFVPSFLPIFDERDRIMFHSTLSPLRDETYLPDEIDYNRPLRLQGVIAEGMAEPENIKIVYPEPGILNSIFRMRANVTRKIAMTNLSSGTKDFLITTLTGDRSFLAPDIRDVFSITGLAHILALSGLHVGIISWVIFIMLIPLKIAGMKGTRIVITIVILWLFAIMTGLSPSVVRAVIMATLLLAATFLERIRNPFNSLCFAAIIILLFTPHAIFTIGFQLSFIAVASILLLANKINPIPQSNRTLHIIVSYFSVAISAMIGTGIISAFYFGFFPIYFLFTNVAISLLLPFLLGGGIILVIAGYLHVNIPWLEYMLDHIYNAIISIAGFTASLPGAHIDGIIIGLLPVTLYFIVLAFIILYLYKRRYVWLVSGCVTALVTILLMRFDHDIFTDQAMYIIPSHSETSVLLKDRKTLWLVTTAHRIKKTEVKAKMERKYQRYMSRRGIDSITLMPDIYKSHEIAQNGNLLHAKGKTILIANSPIHMKSYAPQIDYALVTRGFTGDIKEFQDSVNADTIVLSADIHLRRHNRYANELIDAQIPIRTLRNNPLIFE